MKFYLQIFGMQIGFQISREFVQLQFSLGEKQLIFFDRSFVTVPTCTQCNEPIEDDGHLLKLCDKHRVEYLESWYNRWTDKK